MMQHLFVAYSRVTKITGNNPDEKVVFVNLLRIRLCFFITDSTMKKDILLSKTLV